MEFLSKSFLILRFSYLVTNNKITNSLHQLDSVEDFYYKNCLSSISTCSIASYPNNIKNIMLSFGKFLYHKVVGFSIN